MASDEVRSLPTETTRVLTPTSRRAFAAGAIGIGASTLLGGCFQRLSEAGRDSVDHLVEVNSVRRSEHAVSVRTEFDGETSSYGPRDVGYQAHWEVAQFTKPGELTVSFRVDGEVVWDDAHELPELSGSRKSFSLLELQPDGEILTRVNIEE